MPRINAGIDQNSRQTLTALSSVDGETIVPLYADPTTHALLVDATVGATITLETNGVINGSQSVLNLVAGSNVTLTDNGTGSVTISSTGGSGSPAGSDTQVQFNDGGAFGADSDLTWDKTLNSLSIGSYGSIDGLAGLVINEATSGAYIDMDTVGDIRVVSNTGSIVLDAGASHLVQIRSINTFSIVIDGSALSAARYVAFQDLAGTVALTTQAVDYEVTDNTKGLIIKSADGTRWRIGITNAGELTATSL